MNSPFFCLKFTQKPTVFFDLRLSSRHRASAPARQGAERVLHRKTYEGPPGGGFGGSKNTDHFQWPFISYNWL